MNFEGMSFHIIQKINMSEVPRNFEMKIALLDQKEAETNASFASITAD